ncbi:unnamed protein product [Prunus armeniaca]
MQTGISLINSCSVGSILHSLLAGYLKFVVVLQLVMPGSHWRNVSIRSPILMTTLIDSLTLARKHVDDDDLIDLILNDVRPAYESAVNSIQSYDPPMALDVVIAFLLTAKTRVTWKVWTREAFGLWCLPTRGNAGFCLGRETASEAYDTSVVPAEGPPMPKLVTKSDSIDTVKAQVK